jgi:hypothetical protein
MSGEYLCIFPVNLEWYNARVVGRNAIDEKKLVYQAGLKCACGVGG